MAEDGYTLIGGKAGGGKTKVTLFGIGRLGICTALCLEKAGYDVLGVDINDRYVKMVNDKTLNSPEPRVNEMLRLSRAFRATTDETEAMNFADVIMLVVATPSTGQDDRHYDTSTLSSLLTMFNKCQLKNKHFVICCTVMPGYVRQTGRFLIRDCESCTLSYNPEFIAQGDVINGLLRPDMVLIGEGSKKAGDILEQMYLDMVENSPQVKRMSPESAEITKLAINCFVTTKVAFANMIGDCADRTEGADKHQVLSAVGADSRVGSKYLRPGYGFGGPCFPRDNRALGQHIRDCGIEPLIPMATDAANKAHTALQAKDLLDASKEGDKFVFTAIGYKENCTVPIIEESQKLYIAVTLARARRQITLRDRANLILAAQQAYGSLFEYEVIDTGVDEPMVPQPTASARTSCALGDKDSYGVRRL